MDTNKKYLVTGISGFLGGELVRRLVKMGFTNLVGVARNEGNLIMLKEKYPLIQFITGDISDPFICDKACKDISGIFHLAAFKFVDLAETQTRQCVLSNIIGTMNLLEATRKYNHDFILGISTDKAARVNGVYGATKLIVEKLFQEYEKLNPDTKYRTVRYGNVLYSAGSVLCKWKDKLQKGEEIIVTDLEATRFYWTVDQAVDLIFSCLENATDAAPQHFPMKAIKMNDLLNAKIEKYAIRSDVHQNCLKIIGLQKGENLHEIITSDGKDSSQVERYTQKEIMELI